MEINQMNKEPEHANWCSCTQQAYFKMHAPLLSQASAPSNLYKINDTHTGLM